MNQFRTWVVQTSTLHCTSFDGTQQQIKLIRQLKFGRAVPDLFSYTSPPIKLKSVSCRHCILMHSLVVKNLWCLHLSIRVLFLMTLDPLQYHLIFVTIWKFRFRQLPYECSDLSRNDTNPNVLHILRDHLCNSAQLISFGMNKSSLLSTFLDAL